jgi:hypothetical protein
MMRIVSVIALGATIACSKGEPTVPLEVEEPTITLTGTFALYSVNGKTLPTPLTDNIAQKYEVLEETYTLKADRTFSRSQSYRSTTPPNGVPTPGSYVHTGTYVAKAATITFNGTTTTGGAYTIVAVRNGVDFQVAIAQTQQTLVYKPR